MMFVLSVHFTFTHTIPLYVHFPQFIDDCLQVYCLLQFVYKYQLIIMGYKVSYLPHLAFFIFLNFTDHCINPKPLQDDCLVMPVVLCMWNNINRIPFISTKPQISYFPHLILCVLYCVSNSLNPKILRIEEEDVGGIVRA